MKILSRLLMVAVLLGGLAYGSYAFGRYVLSARLFGTSVVPNDSSGVQVAQAPEISRSVTRKTEITGGKPRVEMEVLAADEAGPGPEPPSLSDLQKNADGQTFTPRTNRSSTIVHSRNGIPPIGSGRGRILSGTDGDSLDGDRPRRKRRKRRRSDDTPTTARSDSATNNTTSDAGGELLDDGSNLSVEEPRAQRDSPERSEPSRTVSSESTRESSSGEERPRRRRRTRDVSSHRDTGETRPDSGDSGRRSERQRRRRTIVSPVPRAEGDSGSPVPQPE